MKALGIVLLILTITSCETRTAKFSGLNDKVVGVDQVVLYENGEFYLELGAGGCEGNYKIYNDTIILKYENKPKNWPDKILMTKDYFKTIPTRNHSKTISIKRQ